MAGSQNRPAPRVAQTILIVVSSLEEIDGHVRDAIHQTVFLRDTPRPAPGKHIFQGFGLSGTFEWVSHDCIDQVEHSNGNVTLALHPEAEVLQELRLKYGDPFRLSLHRASLLGVRWLSRV